MKMVVTNYRAIVTGQGLSSTGIRTGLCLCIAAVLTIVPTATAETLSPAWEQKLTTAAAGGVLSISHDGALFAVMTLKDGKKITAAAALNYAVDLAVHETATGKRIATFATDNVTAFVPLSESRIAVLSRVPREGQGLTEAPMSRLRILGADKGEVVFEQTFPGMWSSLCTSSDGRLLAAGGAEAVPIGKEPCVVRIWNAETFKEVMTLLRKPQSGTLDLPRSGSLSDPNEAERRDRDDRVVADVSSLAFATDDKHLMVATYGLHGQSVSAIIETWSTDTWLKESNILSVEGMVKQLRGNREANKVAWVPFRTTKIAWCEWGGKSRVLPRDIATSPAIALAGRVGRYAGLQKDGNIQVGFWQSDATKWDLRPAYTSLNSLVQSEDGRWVVALGDEGRLVGWKLSRAVAADGQQQKEGSESQKRDEKNPDLGAVPRMLKEAAHLKDGFMRGGDIGFYYESLKRTLAAYDEAVRIGADPDSIMVSENKTLSAARLDAQTAFLDRDAVRAQDLAEQGHIANALKAIESVLEKATTEFSEEARIRYRGIKGGLLASVNRFVEAEPLVAEWAAWCDEHPNSLVAYADAHVGLAAVQLGLGEWGAARSSVKACVKAVQAADKERRIGSVEQRMHLGRSLGQGANVLYQIAWAMRYRRLEKGHWTVIWEAREASSIGTSLLLREEWGVRPTNQRYIGDLLASCAYQELMLGNRDEAEKLVQAAVERGTHSSGAGFVDDIDFALCQLTSAGITRKNQAAARAAMDSAVSIFERLLGSDSPSTISARLQQQLLADNSNKQTGRDASEEVRDCGQTLLRYAVGDLQELDEWKQLGLLRQALSDEFYIVLSLAIDADKIRKARPAIAYEWLLNFKGRSLEAMARRAGSVGSSFSSGADPADAATNWIQLSVLQQRIDEDEAFIDIVRYCRFDHQEWAWQPSRYLMFVVTSTALYVRDLGASNELDDQVAECRRTIDDSLITIRQQGEVRAEKELFTRSEKLSQALFGDLNTVVAEKRRWTVSPDGMLWFLPWELLTLDRSRYVVEQHTVRYVATGREFLRNQSQDAFGPPVIVAAPDYDAGSGAKIERATNSTRRWSSLEASLGEANAISPSIASYTGKKVLLLAGRDATEIGIRGVSSPRILVLSTHAGRVINDSNVDDGDIRDLAAVGMQDAVTEGQLQRWVVALAGANGASNRSTENDDGLLTVGDILTLGLKGTELVVLSACDTGVGDYQGAEAPLDLRRAFRIAGAKAVVASLWKVPDRETAQLMTAFFGELSNGNAKDEALRAAQCSLINQRRADHGAAHPLFWAAFTVTGMVGDAPPTEMPVAASPVATARGVANVDDSSLSSAVMAISAVVTVLVASCLAVRRYRHFGGLK